MQTWEHIKKHYPLFQSFILYPTDHFSVLSRPVGIFSWPINDPIGLEKWGILIEAYLFLCFLFLLLSNNNNNNNNNNLRLY